MEKISFTACLAPISTAIKTHGNEEGGRVTLDIPESDIAALALMLTMRGKAFKVTIEEIDDGEW